MQTGCATPKCHKAPSSSGQVEGFWEAGTGAGTLSVFHLHQASSMIGITEKCPLRTSQFLWGPCHLLGTPFLISPSGRFPAIGLFCSSGLLGEGGCAPCREKGAAKGILWEGQKEGAWLGQSRLSCHPSLWILYRGEVLLSLLQGCTTQSQLEREGRTGTPLARDFPAAAAALEFLVFLEAVRLEKMSEAASFSLSLAPGWGADGSQEIPSGQSSSGNTFSKCRSRGKLFPRGSYPHTPPWERPHPFQLHFLPGSPRSWEVKLPGS